MNAMTEMDKALNHMEGLLAQIKDLLETGDTKQADIGNELIACAVEIAELVGIN